MNKTEALLVIDVQNDFCLGGSLAVPEGEQVVAPINALMAKFAVSIVTQDWHPAGHNSFASSHAGKEVFTTIEMEYGPQILWPDHCIQGSQGAEFHPELRLNLCDLIIRKGYNPAIDSYSAFLENDKKTPTGLSGYLKERGITKIYLVGLATDFCVHFSAMDAISYGFETILILDACRGIDEVESACAVMAEKGVKIIHSSEI